MALLMDSFFRALAYCMLPRVIAWSVLPLALMVILALGGGYFYWGSAIAAMSAALEASTWLAPLWAWLQQQGLHNATGVLAPVLVVVLLTPLIVLVSLLAVAFLMTPMLVSLVGQRRFPTLERQHGGSFLHSVVWSLGSTLVALVVLLLSMPLWLIPPLVLILPPLIWGWLTYRVMAFDALAEHASKAECEELLRRHRMTLLLMGVVCGYLGAAPAIVWASGVLFVAAFFILVPLAIWIYALVFAFSSLWFVHFCLAALQQLRAEQPSPVPDVQPPVVTCPPESTQQLPPPVS
ncbi:MULTISPECIES: EI24 domain-containing protein [Giesbergeria]|uniref:EI24 domain-containing protein n=1 Tax=Giesbergeria sinuosa TaxID=80883 RepID=A0ABV9QD95_9BURK